MEKHAIVKQKNLNTQDWFIMHNGVVEYSHTNLCTSLSYTEYDGNAEVMLKARDEDLLIKRKSDISSDLHFILNKKTVGTLMTEFGIINVDINTHKYIREEKTITVEYDILQDGMILESYRIIWDIKEEAK